MKQISVMRSLMFVPANNSRYLNSAARREADVLLLDCEDSVPFEGKDIARNNIIRFISEYPDKVVFPRINDCNSEFFLQDILKLSIPGVAGFMCPKINYSGDVEFIDKILAAIEKDRHIEFGHFKLILLIESPKALLNLDKIARASKRTVALAFGCEDYLAETSGKKDSKGDSIAYARNMIVNVARAYDLFPIDTVQTDINDIENLKTNLKISKNLGFEGMLVINPKELMFVNTNYSFSKEEYDNAMEIVSLYEEAKKVGKGEAILNGKFIGPPMAKKAQELITKYEVMEKRRGVEENVN